MRQGASTEGLRLDHTVLAQSYEICTFEFDFATVVAFLSLDAVEAPRMVNIEYGTQMFC